LSLDPFVADLTRRLRAAGDAKTKSWWESYVTESAPFLGVKMADIRAIVHEWHASLVESTLDTEHQLDLAISLFSRAHSEEKLAGTLMLQEILMPAGSLRARRDVARFAALFDEGLIADWNVCDWFCVKVLGPLIEHEGRIWAEPIARWRSAGNLWRARASLVAFVRVAADRAWYPAISRSCGVLIRRPERFAKTAVGWILRDVSKHDESFVRQVVGKNIAHFSAESLSNATKYFDRRERDEFRVRLRQAPAGRGKEKRR